ncbi:MAG: hypothetical protein GY816_19535 [Cytophagales bacterium]|nr:hypothetical protein [Cytophagales bacterium]
MDNFWSHFYNNYLINLRERPMQGHLKPKEPTVGQVVLIKEKTPRNQWKMGLITEVLPSKDGYVRSVILRLPSGATTRRPVKLLCPLEKP